MVDVGGCPGTRSCWNLRLLRRHVRPVCCEGSSLIDPPAEQFDLLRCQWVLLLAGRHRIVRIGDSPPQFTLIPAAGDDGVASRFEFLHGGNCIDKTEAPLASGTIGAVAGEAVLRENRADVLDEIDLLHGSETDAVGETDRPRCRDHYNDGCEKKITREGRPVHDRNRLYHRHDGGTTRGLQETKVTQDEAQTMGLVETHQSVGGGIGPEGDITG